MKKILITTFILITFFVVLVSKVEAATVCSTYTYTYPVCRWVPYSYQSCTTVAEPWQECGWISVPYTSCRWYPYRSCRWYYSRVIGWYSSCYNSSYYACTTGYTSYWNCVSGVNYVTRCSTIYDSYYECGTSSASANICLTSNITQVIAGEPITFSWTGGSSSYQYAAKLGSGAWSSWYDLGSITSITSSLAYEGYNYIKVRGYLNGAWRESPALTINVLPAVYKPTTSWITTSKTNAYLNDNIILNWGGNNKPTYYRYSIDGSSWFNIYQTSLSFTPATYSLAEDSRHTIRIMACNSKGCNDGNIGSVSIGILAYTIQPTISYLSPTAITIDYKDTFSLSWSGNNTPTSYNYRINGGSWIYFSDASTLSYSGFKAIDFGWKPRTRYTIEVLACNTKGCNLTNIGKSIITVINKELPGFIEQVVE